MTEKQLKGIKIIRSGNLPVEIFNEKTKEFFKIPIRNLDISLVE